MFSFRTSSPRLKIHFKRFHMPHSHMCHKGYLSIQEGIIHGPDSLMENRICGKDWVILSNSRNEMIKTISSIKNSWKAPAFIITQGNFVQISLISSETKRSLSTKRNFLLEIQPTDGTLRFIPEVELSMVNFRTL